MAGKIKFTFQGGTHPPQSKSLTKDKQIAPGPDVKQIAVLLSQHIGAACDAEVSKGDTVKAGQKIGDSAAFVSSPVHSPVNGKVKSVSLQSHPVLGRCMAVIIDVDNTQSTKVPFKSELSRLADESRFTGEQICDAIRNCGLVGMGGAGFPTMVKIAPNDNTPKDVMIVNACECEPYITCDYRLMLECPNKILTGVRLAKKASKCKRVFIAIEDNKPQAIKSLNTAVEKSGQSESIKVVPVKTKYPQGGERQLIDSVLGKNVPTGGIPPMIGVLVLNVSTTVAIAEAVIDNKPLTHRVVTVSGQAVANPGNFYVPIGTKVAELLEFCGGVTEKSAKVIMGGPMMGIAIADMDTPITKTSGSILVLTKKQIGKAKYHKRQTPCIRCGRCLEVCPEHLNPTRIAHAVKHDLLDVAESYFIKACIECGCCSYVCPAKIELTGHIKTGKIYIARKQKRIPQ